MFKRSSDSLTSLLDIGFITDNKVRNLMNEYEPIIQKFFSISSNSDREAISNYIVLFSNYLTSRREENSYSKLISLLFFFAKKRPRFLGTIADLYVKVFNSYQCLEENINSFVDFISLHSPSTLYLCNYFTTAVRYQNPDTFNQTIDELLFPHSKQINELLHYIYRDDCDKLMMWLQANEDAFMDDILPIEYQDPFYILYGIKDLKLIDMAALFESVNCFKYLYHNACSISDTTIVCSIIGGNCEIVQLLRAKSDSFANFFITTIEYHRYDITDWLISDNTYKMIPPSECLKNYNFYAFYFFYSKGISLDEKDSEQLTSFEEACLIGFIPAVHFILSENSNQRQIGPNGMTALHIATKYGNIQVARYLLSNLYGQNNKNVKDKEGMTVLHYACKYNYIQLVQYFVSIGCDVNATDNQGNTPLITACKSDYYCQKAIEFLVTNGCVKDAKDKYKRTALHVTCEVGNFDAVKYLVSQGYDIDAVDKFKNRPIHYACGNNTIEPFFYYIYNRNDQNTFPKRLFDIVEYLITRGCNKNAKCLQGMTPLHVSCKYGFVDIVKYLVTSGCDVNVKDDKGRTPLHYSIKYDHLDIFNHFISEVGIDINIRDKKGRTPLHLAIKAKSHDIINFLLAKRCNFTIKDNSGKTPLQYAVDIQDFETSNRLLYETFLPEL